MLAEQPGLFERDIVTRGLEPIFKWPGGKRWLTNTIRLHVRASYDRLIEPFCGGAALFFATLPESGLLADANGDLINAYLQIRDGAEDVFTELDRLDNSEEAYYQIRNSRPTSDIQRAARFIYLTRLSFNGIYRENYKGEFNVPYGYKTHLNIYDSEKMRVASKALARADLLVQGFKDTLESAGKGDFVYCDPPYTVAHNQNGFVKYNQNIFTWEDQRELAKQCEAARQRGALVIVSNADHQAVRELYPRFSLKSISRFSKISAVATGRKEITELLAIGEPGCG